MQKPRLEHVKRRSLRTAAAFGLGVASLCVAADPASAQDTRAEVIQQQQVGKTTQLQPPQMNGVERLIDHLEDWGFMAAAPRGFYPWFGSVYPGGGFAGGAGVRKPFGDDGAWNVFGGYSAARFARVEGNVALPRFAANRARVTLLGKYVDAPEVGYFGVGGSSLKEDQVYFGYTPSTGGGRLDFDVSKYFSVGGGVEYSQVDTSEGRTGPAIEERFSPADTPGLELSTFKYVKSTARASFDWRRRPGYSGRGGTYRVQFDDFNERDSGAYSFKSVEAEALQLIPILRANWVIALRGVATVTDLDDSSNVPYFLLPSLGGGSTLRGYQDFRFRDRNRLLMNAELRWTPARIVDMAIFYDAGKVTARREDLDFNDLKESYGIGLRLIGVKGYVFRVEAAHSRENNFRLIFTAGGAF
jgi:Omp85 superfamily domain